MHTSSTRTRILVVLSCLLSAAAPVAIAQNAVPGQAPQNITINDLRRENDRLRQQIDQLAAQLTQSTKTVEGLESRVTQLTAEIEALRAEVERQGLSPRSDDRRDFAPSPSSAEPEYAAIPADNPYASPDALLQAVIADYERAHAEHTWGALDADRLRRSVADWSRSVNRKFRSRVEWLVDVTESQATADDGMVVRGLVVDSDTGHPYGPMEVTIELTPTLARKVTDSPNTTLWRVIGTVAAAPRMNSEREVQGFFDVPAFIGPYAEFEFEFRALGLAPAALPEPADDAPEQPR